MTGWEVAASLLLGAFMMVALTFFMWFSAHDFEFRRRGCDRCQKLRCPACKRRVKP